MTTNTPGAGDRRYLDAVDPELRPWVEAMPDETWSEQMLPARRALIIELANSGKPPLRSDVTLEERRIRGPGGAPPVRVLIARPRAAAGTAPVVLHFHGGGYVAGLPEMARPTIAAFAGELGAVVVSVDYRLAPETRFPGALEDCYAALAWLNSEAATLGIDVSRIAVSGDSAGGGLAAGLTLLARDRREFAIAFQHLAFPALDDRTTFRADVHPPVGHFIWTQASSVYTWTALLGVAPERADVSPYAAPARAKNLAGLPPACIQVGALDLFVDENIEYSRRLIASGVPCELHVYPGAPHSFPMAWRAGVTRAFERDGLAALGKALQPAKAV